MDQRERVLGLSRLGPRSDLHPGHPHRRLVRHGPHTEVHQQQQFN